MNVRLDDLNTLGGPCSSTLRKMRQSGKIPTEGTLVRLELALGWAPRSARTILAGGEPVEVMSSLVGNVSARVMHALSGPHRSRTGATAAELRKFLLAVAEELEGFYTEPEKDGQEGAHAHTA